MSRRLGHCQVTDEAGTDLESHTPGRSSFQLYLEDGCL